MKKLFFSGRFYARVTGADSVLASSSAKTVKIAADTDTVRIK